MTDRGTESGVAAGDESESSTHAITSRLERYPGLEFKLDPENDWTPELIEEIAEIATKLRQRAGLPKEPTGLVTDLKQQARTSTRKATSRSKAGTR